MEATLVQKACRHKIVDLSNELTTFCLQAKPHDTVGKAGWQSQHVACFCAFALLLGAGAGQAGSCDTVSQTGAGERRTASSGDEVLALRAVRTEALVTACVGALYAVFMCTCIYNIYIYIYIYRCICMLNPHDAPFAGTKQVYVTMCHVTSTSQASQCRLCPVFVTSTSLK